MGGRGVIYTVTVDDITYWSKRKLDAIYKHIEYRYYNESEFRVVTESRLQSIKRNNKVEQL